MAQFNLDKANQVLQEIISQHQDVADQMTPEQVDGYLAANYPWLEGLAKFYQLDVPTVSKAACCWSFQWGLDYNAGLGNPAPFDQPILPDVWTNPSDYKARCIAFTDRLGALQPFVGKGDSLKVRPEYGGT